MSAFEKSRGTSSTIFLWAQPYIGVGPAHQAELLAEAVTKRTDVNLAVAFGGSLKIETDSPLKSQRVQLIKLPEATVDPVTFTLLNAEGEPFTEAGKEYRREVLLNSLREIAPDVIVLHNYLTKPNSHYLNDFELDPLLTHAKKHSIPTCSSTMDCFQGFEQLSDQEQESYLKAVREQIECFLVRGDSAELLNKSFPFFDRLSEKIRFVGYPSLDPNKENCISNGNRENRVIVSAGGSELAEDLFLASISAFQKSRGLNCSLKDSEWIILVGSNFPYPVEDLEALTGKIVDESSAHKIKIKSMCSRKEYQQLLATSSYSISEIGQNTFVDLEQTHIASVVVPYEGGGRFQEQLYRAEFLDERGRAVLVREKNINPQSLISALLRSEQQPLRNLSVSLGGQYTLLESILSLCK